MSRGQSTSVQTLSLFNMTVISTNVDASAFDYEELFDGCETGNDILVRLEELTTEQVWFNVGTLALHR